MNPTQVNDKVVRLFKRKLNNPIHTNFSALGFSQRALCWNSTVIDGRRCFQGAFKFEDEFVKDETGARRQYRVSDERAYVLRVYINEHGSTTGVAFRISPNTVSWKRRVISNVVWAHLASGEGAFSIEKVKVPPRVVATSGAAGSNWADKPYKQVLALIHWRIPKSAAARKFPELSPITVGNSFARRYFEREGLLSMGELIHAGEWHEFSTETRHWVIPNTVALHAAPLDLRRSRKQLQVLRSAEKQLITTAHLVGKSAPDLVRDLWATGTRGDVEAVVRDVEAGNAEPDALLQKVSANTIWRKRRVADAQIHADVLNGDKELAAGYYVPTYPRPAPGRDDGTLEIRRWHELEAMAALYAPKPKEKQA